MYLPDLLADYPAVLTEGALIERLRRDSSVELDPHILHATLTGSEVGRDRLGALYRQHFDIARDYRLPMLVCTPTWRANPERTLAAGLSDYEQINKQAVRFVDSIRSEYEEIHSRLAIGGLIGCRGDAYRPEEALSEASAFEFHRPQLEALAWGGVDFLMASTLPAISEAHGIARAMSACGVPYIISFVVRPTGRLLDGTLFAEAIDRIDQSVDSRPICYMSNCVHHQTFAEAMLACPGDRELLGQRLLGLQANTSSLPPEALDGLDHLEGEEPESFARGMFEVHQRFGVNILGGCCGSDDRHIRRLAELLTCA